MDKALALEVAGNWPLTTGHCSSGRSGLTALPCAGGLPPQRPPDVFSPPCVGSMQPCACPLPLPKPLNHFSYRRHESPARRLPPRSGMHPCRTATQWIVDFESGNGQIACRSRPYPLLLDPYAFCAISTARVIPCLPFHEEGAPLSHPRIAQCIIYQIEFALWNTLGGQKENGRHITLPRRPWHGARRVERRQQQSQKETRQSLFFRTSSNT